MPKKSCDYSLHRDRGQVVPQWHKTASKFHRIRCTKCFTSPDNHQKKGKPNLQVVCLPVSSVETWCNVAVKELQKGGFRRLARLLAVKNANHKGSQGTAGSAGHHKRCKTERPTVAIYLDELPI